MSGGGPSGLAPGRCPGERAGLGWNHVEGTVADGTAHGARARGSPRREQRRGSPPALRCGGGERGVHGLPPPGDLRAGPRPRRLRPAPVLDGSARAPLRGPEAPGPVRPSAGPAAVSRSRPGREAAHARSLATGVVPPRLSPTSRHRAEGTRPPTGAGSDGPGGRRPPEDHRSAAPRALRRPRGAASGLRRRVRLPATSDEPEGDRPNLPRRTSGRWDESASPGPCPTRPNPHIRGPRRNR